MLLGGYKLKENKRMLDSLQKIFGIGSNKANQIICALGLLPTMYLKDLNYQQQLKLGKIIVHYVHGFRAKRNRDGYVAFLQQNKSYRGVRHTYFLSVRGQRTRVNAKTQRNKKNKKKNKTGKKLEKVKKINK